MVRDTDVGSDEQDQSEVLDEDNQSLDGAGGDAEMRTFDELPDVLDVTSAVGDADDEAALIAEELDDDEIIQLEADAELADFEDDDLATRMPEALEEESVDDDERSANRGAADEVALDYAGDLDDASVRQGKRTTAMESRNLDDEDLEDLGYPGEDEPAQHGERAEIQRRR
ncbi:MAG TPA: hypothetical protein VF138_11335 [Caulobacteraceae bacterium]